MPSLVDSAEVGICLYKNIIIQCIKEKRYNLKFYSKFDNVYINVPIFSLN